MGMIRAVKAFWRFLLLLGMILALAACVVVVFLNWYSRDEVHLMIFGDWQQWSLGSVLGVGILMGAVTWLLLSRLPAILRAGKREKQRLRAKQNAQDAQQWRKRQAELTAAREKLAAAGESETDGNE